MKQTEENVIDPKIKSAFARVMDFKFPLPTSRDIQDKIQAEAEFEAESSKHLLLNEHCMTNGMRTSCLDPALISLAEFHECVDRFEMSITPYQKDMQAFLTLEDEIDKLEKQSAMSEHLAEQAVAADQRFGEARATFESDKRLYEDMWMEKNRIPAKDFPRLIYILVLVGIGVVEWAINYNAILEQYDIPIFAIGVATILALAVACASHAHGSLLKQHEYYFGDAVPPNLKRKKLIYSGGAALVLLLTLGFVGWSRYLWMAAELARETKDIIIIGGGPSPPAVNITQEVLVTMVVNVLVYLIGVAVAYWVHDADPDYTTHLRTLKKSHKIWNSWQTKVTAKKQVILAELKNKIQAARNKAPALEDRFKPLTDMKKQVDEKKNRILRQASDFVKGLVNTYRAQLVAIARVNNMGLQFNNNGSLIGIDEYGHISVTCPETVLLLHQNQELPNG